MGRNGVDMGNIWGINWVYKGHIWGRNRIDMGQMSSVAQFHVEEDQHAPRESNNCLEWEC